MFENGHIIWENNVNKQIRKKKKKLLKVTFNKIIFLKIVKCIYLYIYISGDMLENIYFNSDKLT